MLKHQDVLVSESPWMGVIMYVKIIVNLPSWNIDIIIPLPLRSGETAILAIKAGWFMVLALDGNSEHQAHARRKIVLFGGKIHYFWLLLI